MAWLVYRKSDTLVMTSKTGKQYFAYIHHAEKLAKELTVKYPHNEFIVCSNIIYHERIERQVERVNIMTGKKYMESVNTPLCCSPASETYWSM
jgi:hypothetical protein